MTQSEHHRAGQTCECSDGPTELQSVIILKKHAGHKLQTPRLLPKRRTEFLFQEEKRSWGSGSIRSEYEAIFDHRLSRSNLDTWTLKVIFSPAFPFKYPP